MNSTDPRTPIARSPVTLADITGDLLWPQLLESARLALSPGRLLLAMFVVVGVFIFDSLASKLGAPAPGPAQAALVSLKEAAVRFVSSGVPGSALPRTFADPLASTPWYTWLLALPALVIFVVGGAAISRSVACQHAARVRLTWAESLGFALGRSFHLLLAHLGPLVLVGVCLGVLWLAGWLLQWPITNVIAGAGYGLYLLVGLIASLILTGLVLGQSLLVPAVACDAADGFGAVERAFAYTSGRTGRLLLYTLIATVHGLLAFVIVSMVIVGAGVLVEMLTHPPVPGDVGATDIAWHTKAAARLVSTWNAALGGVLMAYVVSFYFTASTIIYLLLRRLCDGQDVAEVWMPGMIDQTLAAAGKRSGA